ncbi:MAG TPA: Gfo/Idh/MocA family oxidoreductase [Polyangia bacterium]|nr:Gfo/Idh/MocA family oxidoreductase [Polyangia bacterium]
MVRWGILGASLFATRRMIPAIQRGRDLAVTAIASRSKEKADKAASELKIAKAYGSYEDLLRDPEIDAVYIPLPNHLHMPYAIKAAEAGKHVLCEKPIALSAAEARSLLAVRDRCGVLIQEAAMVRVHPRWLATRAELAKGAAGKIGELRSIVSSFGYNLRQRENVRYRADMGGGTLLDVGFYPVTVSRLCYGAEPTRVIAALSREAESGVDVLASAILEFPGGMSVFSCGMQLSPSQHVALMGSKGRISFDVPWSPYTDRATRLIIDRSEQLEEPMVETVSFEPCNQYTLLAEGFARAIREGGAAPLPLEDSVKNMAVLDALARSATSGKWEAPLG